MDRALWLLLRLRLGGFLRRWGRNLRTIKGLLLSLVGSLMFVPMAIFSLFAPRVQLTAQVALIRRYGALGLFAICLLNLLLASDERAVYFSPAEVDFLFPGPFRRRQLLLYRMAAGLFSSLCTALVMTFVFGHHANSFLPALIGLFLMIELLVLVAMAVGLIVSTLGALAFNRRRKLLLLAVALLLGVVLLPGGRAALSLDAWELLDRLERSPVMGIVVWPFRPPVMAFTAETLWPELVGWTVLGLAVLVALGTAIVALDAEYYEATATASARIYARLRGQRLAKPSGRPVQPRRGLPMLPWWGGVGPALWRQLTSAARQPDRLGAIVLLFLAPTLPFVMAPNVDVRAVLAVLASLALSASIITGFDFRADLDRMDTLKSLPLPATALAIGEMAVPVLVLSLAQAICLVFVAAWRGTADGLLDSLIFLPPYNALLVEIQTILFLWFPIRIVPGSSMDFANIGRQFLLFFAAFFFMALVAAVTAGLGALVYFFVVASWALTLAVAWLAAAGFVAALVPLVVLAFQQFDVARDAPP